MYRTGHKSVAENVFQIIIFNFTWNHCEKFFRGEGTQSRLHVVGFLDYVISVLQNQRSAVDSHITQADTVLKSFITERTQKVTSQHYIIQMIVDQPVSLQNTGDCKLALDKSHEACLVQKSVVRDSVLQSLDSIDFSCCC